jgi:hypothetical protein
VVRKLTEDGVGRFLKYVILLRKERIEVLPVTLREKDRANEAIPGTRQYSENNGDNVLFTGNICGKESQHMGE